MTTPKDDSGQAVRSNPLLDIITDAELKDAALLAIRVEDDSGFFDDRCIREMQAKLKPGCLVCFLRPNESITAFSAEEMAKHGWFKMSNKTLHPRGGATAEPRSGESDGSTQLSASQQRRLPKRSTFHTTSALSR